MVASVVFAESEACKMVDHRVLGDRGSLTRDSQSSWCRMAVAITVKCWLLPVKMQQLTS
jgi:hypothetical protein